MKSLVELHEGTISVKSKEGEGAEFIIYLPCRTVDEDNNQNIDQSSREKNYIEKINIEFSDIYN